jgi:hypothetical protein
VSGQQASTPRQLRFEYLKPGLLEDRLRLATADQRERGKRLVELMEKAGCVGQHFREQAVKGTKDPNLICRIPAAVPEPKGTIIVGAHYDSAGGDGVIDNWTGAILLPSLFESVRKTSPRHHFEFVGFAAEECGLWGSREYVKQLRKEERKQIVAVITIDSLGLTPTKVWLSHSDAALAQLCAGIAKAMKLDFQARNAEHIAMTDSMSFADAKIPVLSLHSVTTETLGLINSPHDVWDTIQWKDYYDSYRLIAATLAYIDEYGVPPPAGNKKR